MILVDTSIWIELIRGKIEINADKMARFVTCPPIVQEIFQGMRNLDRNFVAGILSIPCIPLSVELKTYIHASEIYRSCMKSGKTVRSSVDCLIAAIAIENSIPVWHRDRDFDKISNVTDLICVDLGS